MGASRKIGQTGEESSELGKAALAEGDFKSAIKHFKKAIEQQPDVKDHRDNLRKALISEIAKRWRA